MQAKDAKQLAAQWVAEEVAHLPGFHGAYLAGGIHRVADDEPWPAYIDVDVHVILDRPQESGRKQDTYLYHGLLLEAYYVDKAGYGSWELVASNPLEAQSFRAPCVLADPTGSLTAIQQAVTESFSRREWVAARCGVLRQQMVGVLDDEALSASMFAMVKVLANIPYIIANVRGKDPTNRRAYCVVREVLHADGREDLYESILAVNGIASVSREEVEVRLRECLRAFDRAVEVFRTPFWSDHRMHDHVRPYIAEGAREMIGEGLHREAMAWIIWNHVVANVVIQADAPEEEKREFQQAYDRLYGHLHTWYGYRNPWPSKEDTLAVRGVVDEVLRYVDGAIAAIP